MKAPYASRWSDHLTAVSKSFSQLQHEKQLGWESPALDAHYTSRQQQQQQNASASTVAATSSSEVSQVPNTVFAAHLVDTEALADRYREHAKMILTRVDSILFRRCSLTTDDAIPPRAFCDLGCAPGGVSEFLVKDLNWRGIGVSLSLEDGGIAMTRSLCTDSVSSRYRFIPLSILDPELCPTVVQAKSALLGSAPFDFVNGGAVQDHGQREASSDGDSSSHPVLPWFSFLVPQLLAALRLVGRGGSVMVVFGMSTCGSLMLLIHILVTRLRIVTSYDKVHFLETMHLAKPPIYLLLQDVQVDEERLAKLSEWLQNGDSTRGTTAKAMWLLEDDYDFNGAVEAFVHCGKELELLWDKCKEFLQTRRERLEAKAMRLKSAAGKRAREW